MESRAHDEGPGLQTRKSRLWPFYIDDAAARESIFGELTISSRDDVAERA